MNLCMIYFGCCACRQFIVIILICFSAKPQRTNDIAHAIFIVFDAIFVSMTTIWGTNV